ncbi:HTH-type transcriptional activator mta [Aquicella siphonis]|uniref:HTH-type transcriptional activator mta n=1 Tax=Aquicella siphonis TaxID=254247 RepID=A0A5E4PJL3_9COXI|nr:MerR family transcriptional regulator [Aquicella siphonis]VVC76603.1 HTH-type transcriptional activator mta [Aquicella siphonis]
MTQWYVKDLSKLTHVSVQTLHHYDRIGLLKPSVRLPNGYRLYSEKDLLKLQQIIALKFFGFELAQIKQLLDADIDIIEHFSAQLQFLQDRAKQLFNASNALKDIISDCQRHQVIPWKNVIKLIEVYRMTQQLEKTWAGKVFNDKELKEYAKFEQELSARFTESEEMKCRQAWFDLAKEVEANLNMDPASETGIALGKRCMDWVNNLYGKQYIHLRNAIWEKGFMSGHGAEEHGLTPASVAWLDKAVDEYYKSRIYNILNQVNDKPSAQLLKQWNDLLNDMYGDDQAGKMELIKTALLDKKVSQAAKKWLKQSAK